MNVIHALDRTEKLQLCPSVNWKIASKKDN